MQANIKKKDPVFISNCKWASSGDVYQANMPRLQVQI
jgi:hypothetical protein